MTGIPDRLSAALADRYRIERELGQGGMATVYLAEDIKHERQVALKVLKPELAAVLGAERFIQEIKTTANLQHPHILPLFDSGEADSFLYYVMPFIDGETIRDRLDRETQLGVDEAVKITMAVADALDYAHRNGVIHRDIKPENILLHDGRPIVADFGIALAVSAAAGGRMTETGLSLGTPHYMSPEQATAEKEITNRSDIYSLGSVLYEMLTGEPPHMGNSAQAIIMKIVTEEPDPVTKMRKSVPANVTAAVTKSLEKLAADRFESAKAFGEALGDPGFTAASVGAPAPVSIGAARSRIPWLVTGASLVTTLVLALRLLLAPPAEGPRVPWLVDMGIPDAAAFRAGMAIAKDGSFLLYGGRGGIWIRRADAEYPARIPGTEGGCCPAISPDGNRVAFVRGNEVRTIPLTGGSSTPAGVGIDEGDDITWTSDGYIVGAVVRGGGLVRIPANGGPAEQYTTHDSAAGETWHWSPHSLGEGRGVVFTIVSQSLSGDAGMQIGAVGPSGGAHAVLMPGRVAAYADPGYLLVTRADGAIVAVPFDPDARRITGDQVTLITVTEGPGTFTWRGYFSVSPDGHLVYVGGDDPEVEMVWLSPSGSVVMIDSAETVRWIRQPTIAPDGNTLAFRSLDDNTIEIRNLRTRSSSRIDDAGTGLFLSQLSFSADSRSILFAGRRPGDEGLYRADLAHLTEPTALLLAADVGAPILSPDERAVYFSRAGENGTDFMGRHLEGRDTTGYVLASGVSRGWAPRLSPDGRWFAFVGGDQDSHQLYLRSTDPTRTETWLISRVGGTGGIRWGANGRELYFTDDGIMKVARLAIDEAPVTERIDSLFPMQGFSTAFALAPDGRFLMTRFRSDNADRSRLMLVDDWRALLRGR